jgi:hypothetical protein
MTTEAVKAKMNRASPAIPYIRYINGRLERGTAPATNEDGEEIPEWALKEREGAGKKRNRVKWFASI